MKKSNNTGNSGLTKKAALSSDMVKLAESIEKLADSISADARASAEQLKVASRNTATDYGTMGSGRSTESDFLNFCLN